MLCSRSCTAYGFFDCAKVRDTYFQLLLRGGWCIRSCLHGSNAIHCCANSWGIPWSTHRPLAHTILPSTRFRSITWAISYACGLPTGYAITKTCPHIFSTICTSTVKFVGVWQTARVPTAFHAIPHKPSACLELKFQRLLLRIAAYHSPNPAHHAITTSVQHLHTAILYTHPSPHTESTSSSTLGTFAAPHATTKHIIHLLHGLHVSTTQPYTHPFHHATTFITCSFQQHFHTPIHFHTLHTYFPWFHCSYVSIHPYIWPLLCACAVQFELCAFIQYTHLNLNLLTTSRGPFKFCSNSSRVNFFTVCVRILCISGSSIYKNTQHTSAPQTCKLCTRHILIFLLHLPSFTHNTFPSFPSPAFFKAFAFYTPSLHLPVV